MKVTEDVKKQLDDIAIEKETYNVTIQRLINENKLLKARCDELKQDKENLTQLAFANRKELLESIKEDLLKDIQLQEHILKDIELEEQTLKERDEQIQIE